jgi:hypothetical protein
VQPYQFHTNIPKACIYNYSFALYPEEPQPSGGACFSRLESCTLVIELQVGLEREDVMLIVIGRNLNIMKYRGAWLVPMGASKPNCVPFTLVFPLFRRYCYGSVPVIRISETAQPFQTKPLSRYAAFCLCVCACMHACVVLCHISFRCLFLVNVVQFRKSLDIDDLAGFFRHSVCVVFVQSKCHRSTNTAAAAG